MNHATNYTMKAKQLYDGLYLVNGNHKLFIEDVSFTRTGEVKVLVGEGGTGTMWFDADEVVSVSYNG